jgi:hypothetical protein
MLMSVSADHESIGTGTVQEAWTVPKDSSSGDGLIVCRLYVIIIIYFFFLQIHSVPLFPRAKN